MGDDVEAGESPVFVNGGHPGSESVIGQHGAILKRPGRVHIHGQADVLLQAKQHVLAVFDSADKIVRTVFKAQRARGPDHGFEIPAPIAGGVIAMD